MISNCANPECAAPLEYGQGHFFLFRLNHPPNEAPINSHSVQHFWLCRKCSTSYTLECRKDVGVVIHRRLSLSPKDHSPRQIAVA